MTYAEQVNQWFKAIPKGEIKLGEHTLKFHYEWDPDGYSWGFDADDSVPHELWEYFRDIQMLCNSTWHDKNHIEDLLEVISKNPFKQGVSK
jgi:hypothetical protein